MQIRTSKIRLLPKLLCAAIIAVALSTSLPASAAQPIPLGCKGSKLSGPPSPAQKKVCDAIPAGCPGSSKAGPNKSSTKCQYSAKASAKPGPQSNTDSGKGPPKGDPAAQVKCVQDSCDLIKKYVNPAINLLSVSFGLIAVISIILGSLQYATSEGDPQKASKAKQRIFSTIVAVVAYLFLFSFLQFLIPGGTFR